MRICFISLLLFLSCSNATKTLPNSIGKISEVIFVSDDNLWQDILQKLVVKLLEGLLMELIMMRIYSKLFKLTLVNLNLY